MAYTITHQRRDGSVERKRVRIDRVTGEHAEQILVQAHRDKMKNLHDKYGWSKDRKHRLRCSIPAAVYEEVFINDGPEAARDPAHLEKRCLELGIDPRTRRKSR
jgi:hypothetical protein